MRSLSAQTSGQDAWEIPDANLIIACKHIQHHMLSQFGKGLHRSLIKSLVPGEVWGLRLIQKLAEDYSETFISLPPVSFDEETGPPSGGSLLSFAFRGGVIAGPSTSDATAKIY